jgi:hypothetical protein
MKKVFGVLGFAVVLAFTVPAAASAAEKAAAQPAVKAPAAAPAAAAPAASMKAGDTAYVCACGASCKCKTIQSKAGNCACGSPLVKATVVKVDKDQIVAKQDGKPEQSYPTPR